MHEDIFYVVWNPEHGIPRIRHQSRTAALAEAKRLAGDNPGQNFFVLVAQLRICREDPVTVVELDEIPF